MIKDGHREETSNFAALSGCTFNNEVCFVSIEPKSVVISLRRSPRCVTEIPVFAVDKDMYTRVSSA